MDSTRRLFIEVFDKDMQPRGRVGQFESASFTDGWLRAGFGQFTVRMDDPIATELVADGARVRVTVLGRGQEYPFLGGESTFLLSGYVSGDDFGLTQSDTLTVTVKSDWYMLDTPAYVRPSGNVKASDLSDWAQSAPIPGSFGPPSPGRIDFLSGYWQSPQPEGNASEYMARLYDSNVRERVNARFPSRAGTTAARVVSPNVNPVLPLMRFGSVADYISVIGEAGDTGMQIGHSVYGGDPYIGIDFFKPRRWEPLFTPESGVIQGGRVSRKAAGVTDVLVGGPGEAAARAFRQFADVPLSQRIGRIHETFRDATGAPTDWDETIAEINRVAMYFHLQAANGDARIAEFENALQKAAQIVLDENTETIGVDMQLSETEGFRWSADGGFQTGDVIKFAPSQQTALRDLRFEQRIVATTISQSATEGLRVTPQLGEYAGTPARQLAKQVRTIAAAVNRQAREK